MQVTLNKIPNELGDIAKAVNLHVVDWIGNCSGVVRRFLRVYPIEGAIEARGLWTKPYDWGEGERPFTQHSWIILSDGRVVDPTRWVFEGAAPYIYVGESDHYDYGANMLHAQMGQYKPTPPNTEGGVTVNDEDAEMLRSYGVVCAGNRLHNDDIFWLSRKAPVASNWALYEFFGRVGRKAVIPIDNWRLLMERESLEADEPETGWFEAPENSIVCRR